MKPLPIFWRLISGYGAILLLSMCGSTFSIFQLNELSKTARSALDSDTRMVGYQERLTDAFLSEVRYGAKYIVTRATGHYSHAREFQRETTRYFGQLISIAPSADIKVRLSRLEQLHLRYNDLFAQEVAFIHANQAYANSRYQEEKDKLLEILFQQLDSLKNHLQNSLRTKLESADRVAGTARRTAIAITLVLLALGVALSIKLSESISTPLETLKRITENYALPSYNDTGNLSPIPEMQELAAALERQKTKLREEAESNARAIDEMTGELTAGLISLKRQLSDLKQDTTTTGSFSLTPISIDTVLKNADHLVRYCVELTASISANREAALLRSQAAQTPVANQHSHAADTWVTGSLKDCLAFAQATAKRLPDSARNLCSPLGRYLEFYKKLTPRKGK